MGTSLRRVLDDTIRTEAVLLQSQARRNAPIVSGELRSSIQVQEDDNPDGAGVLVTVGTNKEYAARIEFGFSGADSLGRVYSQAGNPFMQKAVTTRRPKINKAVVQALTRVLKSNRK